MLLRVPQGQIARLEATFTVDGTPTDLDDVPQVTVTREDGSALIAGPATSVETGKYAYELTPTETDLLDVLRAVWTGERDGVLQRLLVQEVHVIGEHLFTLADLRALEPLSDEDAYTSDELRAARDIASHSLERAAGVAFSPQYAREVIIATGNPNRLLLAHPRPLVVRSVKTNDEAWDEDRVADLVLDPAGTLQTPGRWGWSGTWRSFSKVEVVYEHGWTTPPPRASRAAKLLARYWLFDDEEGTIPDRATSLNTEQGSFSLTTAGTRGLRFDLPEVNAVIEDYGILA